MRVRPLPIVVATVHGTFTYSCEKGERLDRHSETSTVFSGFSNRIQNDKKAIGDVIRHDIKNEISAAPFVAVDVVVTTDIAKLRSVILRYVAKSEFACEVKKAFLGWYEQWQTSGCYFFQLSSLFPFVLVHLFYVAFIQYYLVSLWIKLVRVVAL